MNPTVYIETTIPSYYHDKRKSLENDIARTREWWDFERQSYECFISAVVLDELATGKYPRQKQVVQLVEEFPLLQVTPEVVQIAGVYQARRLMPHPPVADALHVALASFYRIDFLLTWNCEHLANDNKFRALEIINVRMGLHVPRIVTPDTLRPFLIEGEEQW